MFKIECLLTTSVVVLFVLFVDSKVSQTITSNCGSCGPIPVIPPVRCNDGTTEGITGQCYTDPLTGACTWQVYRCPTPRPTPSPTPPPTTTSIPTPAPTPTRICGSDQDCPANYLCQKTSCTAGTGMCWSRNINCYPIKNGVCGCDGQNYDNQCSANKAGVNVNYAGNCATTAAPTPQPSGVCDPNRCTPSTQPRTLCPDGINFEGPTGRCLLNPTTQQCYPEYRYCPTCNRTQCGPAILTPNYLCSNNVTVAGPTGRCLFSPCSGCYWEIIQCPTIPLPGITNVATCKSICKCDLDCQANYFCRKSCCNSESGCCTPKNTICSDLYQPVCGCNGKSFPNPCWAYLNGENIAHSGVCQPNCWDATYAN